MQFYYQIIRISIIYIGIFIFPYTSVAQENDDSESDESKYCVNFDNPPTNNEDLVSFLEAFFSKDTVDIFVNALKEYETIKTDAELNHFYLNEIKTMVDAINEAMRVPNPEFTEPSDPAYAWAWITNFYPYINTEWGCSECESEAYVNMDQLSEKASKTNGNTDDLFFDAFLSSNGVGSGNMGCDHCGYWTIGNGEITEALKKIIEVEKVTDIFDQELEKLVAYMMNLDYATIFGSSKPEVIQEIITLLSLKDYTKFDLSNLEVLKKRINDPKEELIFECTMEDFSLN